MHKRQVQAFYRIAERAEGLGDEGRKIAADIRAALRATFADIDAALARLPGRVPACSGSFAAHSLPREEP